MLLPESAHARDSVINPAPHRPARMPDMDSKTATSRAQHHPRVEDDALVRGAGHFIARILASPGRAVGAGPIAVERADGFRYGGGGQATGTASDRT